MERECLDLLLRGRQPDRLPGRGLESMRVPRDWRAAVDEGRLLVVSPFDPEVRRVTAKLAEQRNALVEALSSALLIIHAAPGGKTERMAIAAADSGKPVFQAVARAESRGMEVGDVLQPWRRQALDGRR